MVRSLVLAALGFALIATGALLGLSKPTSAQTATVMSIDLDPSTGGVQSTLTVPLATDFHIRVRLDDLSVSGYVGYQVKLFYSDDVLDAVGLPASWNSAPTATEGGNVASFPNGSDCGPAPGGNALQDNDVLGDTTEDDLGTNSILVYCNDNAVQGQSTLQDLVDFVFQCTVDGERTFTLADLSDAQGGSNVTDEGFTPRLSSTNSATVTCGAGGATSTPTITPTPTLTSTPTRTFTPTATPKRDEVVTTPTPRVTPDFAGSLQGGTPPSGVGPGGGPGGVLRPPDTGDGYGMAERSEGREGVAAVGIVLLGIALVGAGAGLAARSRRSEG